MKQTVPEHRAQPCAKRKVSSHLLEAETILFLLREISHSGNNGAECSSVSASGVELKERKKKRQAGTSWLCPRCVCPSITAWHTHTFTTWVWNVALGHRWSRFTALSSIAACGGKSGQRNFLVAVIVKISRSTAELFTSIIASTREEAVLHKGRGGVCIWERDNAEPGPCHWRWAQHTQIQLPPSPAGNKSSLAQETRLRARDEGTPEGRVFDSPGHGSGVCHF